MISLKISFLLPTALSPTTASFYCNRSACHVMLSQFPQALSDARQAARIEPGFARAHLRAARCCLALGDTRGAREAVEKAK